MARESGVHRRVEQLIGVPRYEQELPEPVSRSEVHALCAAVQNACPVFWDSAAALRIVGEEIAPTAMLSTWGRPGLWSPHDGAPAMPLQLHSDLKALYDFPVAIVSSVDSVFHAPVRVGDRVRTVQVLRSVSEEKETRLGRGRFWVVEMQYRRVDGELLGIESFSCFGYRRVEAQ